MIAFPHCKINLGLQVLNKRADGFHNIETIFYPIKWRDIVEIIPSKSKAVFTSSGITIDGDSSTNLCQKAYHLLKDDFPSLPVCNIHLHKNIPIGAGLGGGSSDASIVLSLLNSMFCLGITISQLEAYALRLGSDCPFFLHEKTMLATGRGEILKAIDLSLQQFAIVLVNPGIHVNTGWAFSQLNLQNSNNGSLEELILQPIELWQGTLKNDFEPPIFAAHPAIEAIKLELLASGALYAAMSGSGSTVFGIYQKKIDFSNKFPASYILHWV